jgi:hypothetical protein
MAAVVAACSLTAINAQLHHLAQKQSLLGSAAGAAWPHPQLPHQQHMQPRLQALGLQIPLYSCVCRQLLELLLLR